MFTLDVMSKARYALLYVGEACFVSTRPLPKFHKSCRACLINITIENTEIRDWAVPLMSDRK